MSWISFWNDSIILNTEFSKKKKLLTENFFTSQKLKLLTITKLTIDLKLMKMFGKIDDEELPVFHNVH